MLDKLDAEFAFGRQALDVRAYRQELLSSNIANADTPGYVAMDLKPLSFREGLAKAAKVTMARSDAAHLSGGQVQAAAFRPVEEKKPYEASPTGNGVVIEEQMVKLAETQMDYQMITNLYRKQVGMIKTALGRTG